MTEKAIEVRNLTCIDGLPFFANALAGYLRRFSRVVLRVLSPQREELRLLTHTTATYIGTSKLDGCAARAHGNRLI